MAIHTYKSGSCTVTYDDGITMQGGTEVHGYQHVTVTGNGAMEDYTSSTCRNTGWYNKGLKTITIGEGVTSIGDYAFYSNNCYKDGITLPTTLKRIGAYALYNKYDNISYDGGYINTSQLSSSITYFGDYCLTGSLYGDINDLVSKLTPSTFIGTAAFKGVIQKGAGMHGTLRVPSFMTTLTDIFFRHNIGIVVLHENVTEIGTNALAGCKFFNTLEIPENSKLTTIGDGAFSGCTGLVSFSIPDKVTKINKTMFSGCTKLETITLHDNITSIESNAFYNCTNLKNINFSKKLTSIGSLAFANCTSLTGCMEIPDTVIQNEQFGANTNPFYGCTKLTKLIIGEKWNDLSILQLPNVSKNFKTVINRYPNSQDLSQVPTTTAANTLNTSCKVYIHPNNTGFKDGATKFNITNQSRLRDIAVYYPKQFTLSNGTVDYSFNENTDKGSLSINISGDLENFTEDSCLWKVQLPFIYSVVIADTLTKLGDFSLTGCMISEISLPSKCVKIGNSTFKNCTNLTTITQISKITELGVSSFENCSKLSAINLNCTSIPNSAFKNCSVITNNPITKLTKIIGDSAFENCTSLTSYNLNNITSLGNYAFSGIGDIDITELQLPDTLTHIGSNVFNGNTITTDIINGAPLQTIDADAFNGMTALTTIYGNPDNDQLIAAAGDKFADIGTLAMIVPFVFNGRQAYPVTSSAAVKCTNDKTLDVILKEYEKRLAALESK